MCILMLASHLVHVCLSATFLVLVESSQEKMPVPFGEPSVLQCQSPCWQGLYLQVAKVEKAIVESLASDSPLPIRKETGDCLWSHCNEHIRSTVCERLYCDLVVDLGTNFESVSTSFLYQCSMATT